MNSLKFKYTILYVEDVVETMRFFENAFGFSQAMLHESGDYGELDTGPTKLTFASLTLMADLGKSPASADSKNPTFEIAFETHDVHSALSKALAAGATLEQAAKEMPWGQTTAYISDANGFLIELCTPVAAQS